MGVPAMCILGWGNSMWVYHFILSFLLCTRAFQTTAGTPWPTLGRYCRVMCEGPQVTHLLLANRHLGRRTFIGGQNYVKQRTMWFSAKHWHYPLVIAHSYLCYPLC